MMLVVIRWQKIKFTFWLYMFIIIISHAVICSKYLSIRHCFNVCNETFNIFPSFQLMGLNQDRGQLVELPDSVEADAVVSITLSFECEQNPIITLSKLYISGCIHPLGMTCNSSFSPSLYFSWFHWFLIFVRGNVRLWK